MRYVLADLDAPPRTIWCGHETELTPSHLDFIQPNEKWALFLYRHSGLVNLDRQALTYQSNDLLIVPPGSRVCHARVGPGTPHYWLQFILDGTGSVVSLPTFVSLEEPVADQFGRALAEIWRTDRLAKALTWSLLWNLSSSEGNFRANVDIYRAEDWIRKNLDRPFTVSEMADALGFPAATLGRMFQAEHRMTVKQFVKDVRVREAVRLLASTFAPIKSIARTVGIGNSQQFNKFLRMAMGVSPQEIRRRAMATVPTDDLRSRYIADRGLARPSIEDSD